LEAVGIRATARELDDGFVVLAGSPARQDGTEEFRQTIDLSGPTRQGSQTG
jgi:hypothetical protein